jgi:hypothetical protein
MSQEARRIRVGRFGRIAALAVIVLVGSLVSVAQASAKPAQSSVRGFTYITHRAPAPPLAGCTAPADAPNDPNAFLRADWRMMGRYTLTRSTFKAPPNVATGFASALNAATGTWEATDLPNVFRTVTPTADKPRQKRDGENIVGFANGAAGALGVTRFWIDTSTDTVEEFDILLNLNFPWSTALNGAVNGCSGTAGAFDVQAVLTHELGHPVGLEHVTNDAQTMFGFVATGETRKRSLEAGDLAGVNGKY